jgi:uncharacterized protein
VLNTVTWFEIATDDPGAAQRFYGGLFGWRFAAAPAMGTGYHLIGYPGAERSAGGLFDTRGRFPAHAIFHVQVADVEETCRQAESSGGKVLAKVVGTGPDFACLLDPAGNRFGVFTPRR